MRFLRLYKTFVKQYFKQLMEYRVDFLTGAMSFLVNQITNILFISIIFSNIPNLAGWSYNEIIFIYGFSLLPKGIDHFTTDNLWKVAYFIVRKGDFDKYLTRPINPLVHVIIENFQFDALGEFITGIVLVVYASVKMSLRLTFVNMLLFIIAVIFGTFIFTSIKIACAAIAFWVKRSGSILQVFYMSSDFARYPVTIYNKAVRYIISYIVPFAFTSFYPASYFLRGGNALYCIGGTVAISMIFMVISVWIWNRGISAYESAGS
ncbi:ABC transporter permease [Lachnospiraceae bacterium HCP1S3_C3]|nr:ABC-2 family transporter protein [Lachnospiraceae bacterium]MDD6857999.1 ABC-2 family transporter protein [Lachnospiraceae bacterium]